MQTHIDHLVVVAHTLEQGVQWCEATLGIVPAPGGEHVLYGAHSGASAERSSRKSRARSDTAS